MALKPVTVSQLNEYISRILSTDPLLGNISVKGEITNLKYHSSGHVYFSMIDDSSKINCFLPASYARNLNFQLGDGMEITVHGYINVYKKGGAYTLFIRTIEVSGEEGLFDPAHKKRIPEFPGKVGVVTSATGAAVRDILKIISSRTKLVDVTVFPVLVQGSEAAANMAATLDMINEKFRDIDVLILGRGGGSSEDLWAFNEEKLARAVYRSDIPIISAVGHETDFSICDFVADLRAETPTAAAEIAVPDDRLIKAKIDNIMHQLSSFLQNKLEYYSLLSESCRKDMKNTLTVRIQTLKHKMEKAILTLEENNPAKVLSKGYAIIKDTDGQTVSSASDMEAGAEYKFIFRDGTVNVVLSSVRREGE